MKFTVHKVADGERLWEFVEERFPQGVKYLRDPKDDGDYHFFVATADDGAYLGGSVIDVGTIDYGPLKEKVEGFLEDIEVEAEFRRRGVGTALLRAALGFAWSRGARHVRWTVSCDNAAGVAFYDACGCSLLPEKDEQNPDDEYYLVVVPRPGEATSRG